MRKVVTMLPYTQFIKRVAWFRRMRALCLQAPSAHLAEYRAVPYVESSRGGVDGITGLPRYAERGNCRGSYAALQSRHHPRSGIGGRCAVTIVVLATTPTPAEAGELKVSPHGVAPTRQDSSNAAVLPSGY